jgi:hypothetical protein
MINKKGRIKDTDDLVILFKVNVKNITEAELRNIKVKSTPFV